MTERKRRPQKIGDVLASFLDGSGLKKRVDQAAVVPEWESLVGPQIAAATTPLYVMADGTLLVAVKTHAWMSELSLLEPQLLRGLNVVPGRSPIKRLRFVLER
jgi:predicted nucleic acid-binding Zn ribbon protein